jgi:hypothetical protein
MNFSAPLATDTHRPDEKQEFLQRVRAKDIHPDQPWSAFALKHHFVWEVSAQHFRRCAQQAARRELKSRLAA